MLTRGVVLVTCSVMACVLCFRMLRAEWMHVRFQMCNANAMEVLLRKYSDVEVRNFDIEGCHKYF